MFLGALTPDEADDLVARGRPKGYRAGQYLMREGEPSQHVVVLRQGRVRVVKVADDGREILLGIKGPGDLLGEISTIDGGPRTADVMAIEPVDAVVVPASEFDDHLRRHPRVGLVILRIALHRLRTSERRRAEFSQDTSSRLARQLLDLLAEHGRDDGGAKAIGVPLTHDELAAMVGASRETVSRALAGMRNEGLIATQRRTVRVLDEAGLQRLAEPAWG